MSSPLTISEQALNARFQATRIAALLDVLAAKTEVDDFAAYFQITSHACANLRMRLKLMEETISELGWRQYAAREIARADAEAARPTLMDAG